MSGMVRWPRARRVLPGPTATGYAASLAFVRPDLRAWLIEAPDFWRLWLVGLVVFGVRWLEMLAVAVFAYQHTHSPFVVAALTMLRMLPMALFGAVIGALAERCERRTALILVVLSMVLTSLTLAVLAWTGALAVWHLAVAALFNGIGWTADNPVRRTMIGDVVGPERMSSAMSIDVGANNASQIVGPTIGGVLLAIVRDRRRVLRQRPVLSGRPRRGITGSLSQPCRSVEHTERIGADGRGSGIGPPQPAADRHPDRHHHLQHVRLAVRPA